MSDLQSPFASKAQRDQARNAKKEAVLRAAVDLFNERGFHATSLDDIASRLGITKKAIYNYFGNKDQVLFHGLTRSKEHTYDVHARMRITYAVLSMQNKT